MNILDCTLRDGGYYTDWDFSDAVLSSYLEAMDELPVDYVEVGYRNLPANDYLGRFGYTPVSVLERIRRQCGKKLAVMLNEKSTRVSDLDRLLSPVKEHVSLVRLAVAPDNVSRARKLAEEVKRMGFDVAFNLMYMSKWNGEYPGLFNQLRGVGDVVDVMYMVDSFGGVTPDVLQCVFNELRTNVSCKIGFHGHNNMQLALANTIKAMELGVDTVDSTILGMGRGAGNLATELLLVYLNSHNRLEVDFNVLGNVVGTFNPLMEQYRWGTNLPYMIAGANQIPQKEVMDWVTNRVYSFNSVVRAVDNRRNKEVDNARYPLLELHRRFENVIVVGGGQNASEHSEAVKSFVHSRKDVALVFATSRQAASYLDMDVPKYYCLVGNEGRRHSHIVGQNQFDGICVLPPYPRLMGTEIPAYAQDRTYELPSIDFIGQYTDSVTSIALQLALNLSSGNIYIVGYDGYSGGAVGEKEMVLTNENNAIFAAFAAYAGTPAIAITDSVYQNLNVKSVYQYI